jgi:hypothetical protein
MKERWTQCYKALLTGSPQPKWATQDNVIRALKELAMDLECGLVTQAKGQEILSDIHQVAYMFRCLEHHETIKRLVWPRRKRRAAAD